MFEEKFKKMFSSEMKKWLAVTLILSAFILQNTFGQQQSHCSLSKDCTSCMKAGPECYWCEDQNFTASGNLIRPRCNEFSVLSKICTNLKYLNSSVTVTQGEPFSSTVQASPQNLKLVLRPGLTQTFRVAVQPAENFPVDIYVLMDLSKSMEDDLENLAKLTTQIARSIGNITTNYRLGFGAFIDKPTTPFIPVRPQFFPCAPRADCRPVFGYVHAFDFSNNVTAFQKALDEQAISGDIDKPEAPLDALMQLAVCEKAINWKPKGASRRIVMIVTDALPKSAGDGRTAGIIKPNDGKCYMASREFFGKVEKYYEKSTQMDYPSIQHLKNVMFENGITPILAVTEGVLPVYQKIAEAWEDLGGAADVLSEDSSNIVQLLRDNYNRISTTVKLSDDSPPHINFNYQVDPTSCNNIDSPSECSNVKLNQSIFFDVTATLRECPRNGEKNQKVTIKTAGFGDIVVDVEYNCDCNCDRISNSPNCNFEGIYECGVCECNQGRFGHLCQCDSSKPSQNDTSTCLDPRTTDGTLCNGFGQCICGKCECFTQPYPRTISGEFCECKNFGCPRFNQNECGGNDRGDCKCGNCECHAPYEGSNCGNTNCSVVTKSKCTNENGEICSNNGECDCKTQKCFCNVGFIGKHCETCETPKCKCDLVQDCVSCMVQNTTCSEKLNCSMHEYYTTNTTISNGCTVFIDGCEYIFNITGDPLQRNEQLTLLYKPTFKCIGVAASSSNDDPNLLAIILGIIAGILLLGLLLLLLWKLLVTLHDKHEYAQFQKSQTNDSQWEKDGNPIYREPNQQFVNPAFAGAM